MFSTRRRRSSSAGDLAVLFALVAALVTITVAILKLLVQGGVAAWKMFGSSSATKSLLQTGASGPTPVAAIDATSAARAERSNTHSIAHSIELVTKPAPEARRMAIELVPPESRAVVEHPYREMAKSQPTIFDDPAALESWGQKAFVLWARELPMAPSDLSGILKSVEPRMRLVGRMRTELDLRKVVWKQEPYRGREAASGAAVDAAKVDPFGIAEEIERTSRYVSTCRGCDGKGESICRECSGSTRTDCESCGGEGKVMGYAVDGSRRRLNCKPCKVRGNFACAGCRSGKVECSSCRGAGKLERWLEVEKKVQTVVRTRTSDGDLRELAWESRDVADADIAKDARIACAVSRAGALEERDLPAEVPSAWREKHWAGMQLKVSAGERIAAQRFQLLELPAAELRYGFAGDQQTVAFEGMRLNVPRASADRLFHARASSLRGYGVVLGAMPVIALVVYAARGPYFLNGLTFGAVMGVMTAALLLFAALGKQTLHRPAKGWALAALAPALGAAVAMVKLVQTYLRAGLLDKAAEELAALGPSDTDAEVFDAWQELYFLHAKTQSTCQAITAEMGRLVERSQRREQAQAQADRAALVAAGTALARCDFAAARSEISCANEAARDGEEGRALRVRVDQIEAARCLNDRDWACVQRAAERLDALQAPGRAKADELRAKLIAKVRAYVDERLAALKTEGDMRRRVATEREAIDLWSRYLMAPNATEPIELVALRSALKRDEVLVAKQDLRESKLRAVEEAKAAAIERKRAAAERCAKPPRSASSARRSTPRSASSARRSGRRRTRRRVGATVRWCATTAATRRAARAGAIRIAAAARITAACRDVARTERSRA